MIANRGHALIGIIALRHSLDEASHEFRIAYFPGCQNALDLLMRVHRLFLPLSGINYLLRAGLKLHFANNNNPGFSRKLKNDKTIAGRDVIHAVIFLRMVAWQCRHEVCMTDLFLY